MFMLTANSVEDEMFVSLSLIHKGKKLIARALRILFPGHVLAIFFVYMRNLAAFVTSPRIEMV
jgi:hypothetical protein